MKEVYCSLQRGGGGYCVVWDGMLWYGMGWDGMGWGGLAVECSLQRAKRSLLMSHSQTHPVEDLNHAVCPIAMVAHSVGKVSSTQDLFLHLQEWTVRGQARHQLVGNLVRVPYGGYGVGSGGVGCLWWGSASVRFPA